MKFTRKSQKYSKFIVEGEKSYNFKTLEDEIKTINGKKEKIAIREDGHNMVTIKFKNKNYLAEIVEKKQNAYVILINGNTYEFNIETPTSHKRKQIITKNSNQTKSLDVKAPMPGKIVDVFVEKGDVIKQGDTVCTLEAMKMQNEILAENGGEVVEISIAKEENVTTLLLYIWADFLSAQIFLIYLN